MGRFIQGKKRRYKGRYFPFFFWVADVIRVKSSLFRDDEKKRKLSTEFAQMPLKLANRFYVTFH